MNSILSLSSCILLLWISLSVSCLTAVEAAQDLKSLDYNIYPRRTEEEAAVFEWGHSAIISALDASVARFGPQTRQAALLEVECMPILATPVNGAMKEDGSNAIKKLRNADEVDGNIVVMTNNGGLTGVEMAKIAKLSGAAALMVVNIDEKRPDDIYRLDVFEGEEADAEDIDIPVVMISLNSANVLTTATVQPHMKQEDIVNNGMPERIRLYAGGDRPFFEDVEPLGPTLYLIHNLLTTSEADSLVETANPRVELLEEGSIDNLQLNTQPENYPGVESVMLWQGKLASPTYKAIEERIEQVTGFSADHFSDFVVDKLEEGAYWKPHFDKHPYAYYSTPIATIIVFLTESSDGGSVVYPGSHKKSIQVLPQKGLAIVHHNMDEKDQLDMSTLHAMLPIGKGETLYVARKYVFEQPISNSRKMALPAFAFLFGGKLPKVVVLVHNTFVDKFGIEDGSLYFDKACVFIPLLLILSIVQFVLTYVKDQILDDKSKEKSDTESKKKGGKKKTKKGKSD
eukprot:CAMPEP_0197278750 /NCGR_PEP_ID=MMETSP1432-20130617/19158_1 /TAXON_ID=44447 /ORGANISM="Pseudo-nitzschia delicatissima, Strain UNC1205" /LENGTH=513 /DNA_ID=CAMNT_0042745181 /DNA_START=97 /DNA_END=1638 /DNA_ORIENTATION=-